MTQRDQPRSQGYARVLGNGFSAAKSSHGAWRLCPTEQQLNSTTFCSGDANLLPAQPLQALIPVYMPKHADAVAECVLKAFSALPNKAKPRVYPNGAREWVPLSGLVISRRRSAGGGETVGQDHSTDDYNLRRDYQCVALGTGMRCLPADKIPLARGVCLHDWHAEIVALRAFNHHLLTECLALSTRSKEHSDLVQPGPDPGRPFQVRDDVEIHMYCSEAPCGDASMELTMQSQDDDAPWPVPREAEHDSSMLSGRGYFSLLGIVRRKPARADAPPTLSKSCSDKLAMKQCTSLLSALTSLFVSPRRAYLTDLILPVTQLSRAGVDRAFSARGRMAGLEQDAAARDWHGHYSFRPFQVEPTSIEFDFSRRSDSGSGGKMTPSNITAAWTPNISQTIIGGTVQGHKQFAPRGASAISRAKLWQLSRELADTLEHRQLQSLLQSCSYGEIKRSDMLAHREKVKSDVRSAVLRPWTLNSGDDSFGLDGTENKIYKVVESH